MQYLTPSLFCAMGVWPHIVTGAQNSDTVAIKRAERREWHSNEFHREAEQKEGRRSDDLLVWCPNNVTISSPQLPWLSVFFFLLIFTFFQFLTYVLIVCFFQLQDFCVLKQQIQLNSWQKQILEVIGTFQTTEVRQMSGTVSIKQQSLLLCKADI